jgi:hypothetical protein
LGEGGVAIAVAIAVRVASDLATASAARPSKGETAAQLKRHILASLAGVTLAAVGYQALAGSLTFQASMQQPGVVGAVGMGNNAITSLEMFSVLANTQVLTGHLIGL